MYRKIKNNLSKKKIQERKKFRLRLDGEVGKKILKMARIVITESESLENALEEKNVTGNMKNAFLFVAVLLGGFIEELDEDRVV